MERLLISNISSSSNENNSDSSSGRFSGGEDNASRNALNANAFVTFDPPSAANANRADPDNNNNDSSNEEAESESNSSDSDYIPPWSKRTISKKSRKKTRSQQSSNPSNGQTCQYRPNYRIETRCGQPLPNNGVIAIWIWLLKEVNTGVFVPGQWWDNSGALQVHSIERYGPNHGRCTIKHHYYIETEAFWRKKNVSPKSFQWPVTFKIGAPSENVMDIREFATTGTNTEDVTWGE